MNDFDKHLEALKEQYLDMKDTIQYLRETLQEWDKDEEIQKWKNKNDWIYNHSLVSNLSDKELKALGDFRKNHYRICCGNGKYKNKGNTWIYTISGTGLGHIIKITCPECGQSEDVTDINNW